MNNILEKIIADKKNSVESYKKSHPLEKIRKIYLNLIIIYLSKIN